MTEDTTVTTTPLTEPVLRAFAVAWYQALDRHDDLDDVRRLLADDELEMVFPETTAHGLSGFELWYDAVTHKFFDEAHEVRSVEVLELAADRAVIRVDVHWAASKWEPPAPASARLDFESGQTWTVLAGGNGPRIQRYVVDSFEPNPGSADL